MFAALLVVLLSAALDSSLVPLPPSNFIHASSGLIFHYLSSYSPSNRVISLTVSIPLAQDMCYLLPVKAIQKIPTCHRKSNHSRRKRFLTDIVSIGIGSAALTLSTINTVQLLNLRQEVKTLQNTLSLVGANTNTHTAQLLHLTDGQLTLARELNHTQAAINSTISLVNDHSAVLQRHNEVIRNLLGYTQLLKHQLTSFIHSIETHFLHTSLTDILENRLNLRFIHPHDLPSVLDYIVSATNVSFNPNTTALPLVDLVSRLIVQQQIDFVPATPASLRPDQDIGVLLISSFFAATTTNQSQFSLYELLPIPFTYAGTRLRLANMPFVIGIDPIRQHLLRWTRSESLLCNFRAMSLCRETPPTFTNWHTSCLYEILTNAPLTACRTEEYPDPIFVHRLGNHWAISTNTTTPCHSISLNDVDAPFSFSDNTRILPPITLIAVPPNTTLVCDGFSIPGAPIAIGTALNVWDSSFVEVSQNTIVDLNLPLNNETRWAKLPYIPDHFQAILDFLASTPATAPVYDVAGWYQHPFSFVTGTLIIVVIGLLGLLIYCRFIRAPPQPRFNLELSR